MSAVFRMSSSSSWFTPQKRSLIEPRTAEERERDLGVLLQHHRWPYHPHLSLRAAAQIYFIELMNCTFLGWEDPNLPTSQSQNEMMSPVKAFKMTRRLTPHNETRVFSLQSTFVDLYLYKVFISCTLRVFNSFLQLRVSNMQNTWNMFDFFIYKMIQIFHLIFVICLCFVCVLFCEVV